MGKTVIDTRVETEKSRDLHIQPSEISVMAGVRELRLLHETKKWKLPVKLTILAPTINQRGIHMSRLVAAAQNHVTGEYIENSLREMCKDINRTQPGSRIVCELEYPYVDQFMSLRIEVSETGPFRYRFGKLGVTACPCSKEIVGIGHMQRAHLKMEIVSDTILDFKEVAEKLNECFSTVPEEHLKRVDEAQKIVDAQENPRFIEDVVRECLKRFPKAEYIDARAFESIHMHDAAAIWRRVNDLPFIHLD